MSEPRKAKIFNSPEKCMTGKELRRLRMEAGLSEQSLADEMEWYRSKVERFEQSEGFCIPPEEMIRLLQILGANSL